MKRALEKNRLRESMDTLVTQSGKIGYALLWLIGAPLPVVLILYMIFGS